MKKSYKIRPEAVETIHKFVLPDNTMLLAAYHVRIWFQEPGIDYESPGRGTLEADVQRAYATWVKEQEGFAYKELAMEILQIEGVNAVEVTYRHRGDLDQTIPGVVLYKEWP